VAVYTHIGAEDMAAIVAEFGVGTLTSAKGIAEGVQNSNYLVKTTQGQYILTVYEQREVAADLPFFLALLDHLADKGCPVPHTIHDRKGVALKEWHGKSFALIEFLPGLSVDRPTPAVARAVGSALGQMHAAIADFRPTRPNDFGPKGWFHLAEKCGDDLNKIAPGLKERVADECAFIKAYWPNDLPRAIVHGDLFPDNVLLLDNEVSGVIDFYFAGEEIRAWDLAVTHAAWSFSVDGKSYDADVGTALIEGYDARFHLSNAERAAFPVLARGACLRFLLTRAWDWHNTPTDALVTRKDPLAFLRRLDHYASL
jgi:homoserine kinase type II